MAYSTTRSTFFCPAGTKWYWEFVPTTGYDYASCGITTNSAAWDVNPGGTTDGHGVGFYGVEIDIDGTRTTPSGPASTAWASGDIIGFAYDVDANTIKKYINGSLDYTYSSVPVSTDGPYSPTFGDFGGSVAATINVNFGADSSFGNTVTSGSASAQDSNGVGDFYYEPPSGYLALCSSNLPSVDIADPTAHFNTVLYVGNGGSSTDAITGVGFKPDLNWIKGRTNATSNYLTDSVRGIAGSGLLSDSVAAEDGIERIASLDSDGFTTADTLYSYVNTSGANYVAWNWKGDGVAGGTLNEDGSIDSYVNVNTTAGFSIVKYTGNDTVGATYGHGLSQQPEMIITRSYENAQHWYVWWDGVTDYEALLLNRDLAIQTESDQIWDVSGFTSSVVELGDHSDVNKNGSGFIAFIFHSVECYSKIGSYEGNGDADGTFVYTGFRPAFVMTKSVDSTSDWQMFDSKRIGYNVDNYELEANDTTAEDTSTEFIDIVSNGFKNRITTDPNVAETYLYIAFAETPFRTANAR